MTCDRCGWTAYLHVQKNGLELDFCGNHGKRYGPKLKTDGWTLNWDVEGYESLAPTARVPA